MNIDIYDDGQEDDDPLQYLLFDEAESQQAEIITDNPRQALVLEERDDTINGEPEAYDREILQSFVREYDAAEDMKEMNTLHQTIMHFINIGNTDEETHVRKVKILHNWMYQYMRGTGMPNAATHFQRDAALHNPEIPQAGFNLNILQPGIQDPDLDHAHREHPHVGMPFQHRLYPENINQQQRAVVQQHQKQNILNLDLRQATPTHEQQSELGMGPPQDTQHSELQIVSHQHQQQQVPGMPEQEEPHGLEEPVPRPEDGEIFNKVLSPSDVGKNTSSAALFVPKKTAEENFKSFPKIPKGSIVEAMDETGRTWIFHLVHSEGKSIYHLRKAWGPYVRKLKVRAGSTVKLEYIGGRLYIFCS